MGKEHIFFYNVILKDFLFIKKGFWVMGRVRCVWVFCEWVCAHLLYWFLTVSVCF